MMRLLTPALLAALVAGVPATAQVTFLETFDDGDAATRWSAPVVDAETGAFDGSVDYAFDYGAVGIPAAPGGGSTTGILFEVNTTDAGDVDEGEAVAIVPTGFELPTGSFYRYSVDAYFNVESQNGGSTEFGLFGVHAVDFNAPGDAGLNDDVPFDFGLSNGNGLAYMASGDSGASNDFHRYEDAGNADAGSQTGLGSYDARETDDPASFPSLADPAGAGPQGVWIEIAIERAGDTVSFIVDDTLIDTFDADGFSAGTILLGYADYFNSVATTDFLVGPDPTPFDDGDGPFGDDIPGYAHFVVYDNVSVTIPEPTTAALGLLSLGALAMRRRG